MAVSITTLPCTFGPYALLSRLGQGGMGDVYVAKTGGMPGFEKHCVVKTLKRELTEDADALLRFTEEARVVVQLQHRNICPVFDVGRAHGRLYMAMEHVTGCDVRTLATQVSMPHALSVYIVCEVLEALDYAHRFVELRSGQHLALVHRDVSPPNILISVDGDVKLIDFGVATSRRVGPKSPLGTVLGKITYMAPEHARGEIVDGRADQWSAAVVLTELLCGASYYRGIKPEDAWALSGAGTHRPAGFQGIEPQLRAILDRALSARSGDRFPSCAAFAEALVGWSRATGQLADARDLRTIMREPGRAALESFRTVVQTHADVVPAPLVASGPGASPWESLVTTMMISPPSAEMAAAASDPQAFGRAMPSTMVVRERQQHTTHAVPARPASFVHAHAKTIAIVCSSAAVSALCTWGLVRSAKPKPNRPVAQLEQPDVDAPIAPEPAEPEVEAKAAPASAPSRPTNVAPPDTDDERGATRRQPEGRAARPSRYDSLTESDIGFLRDKCVGKVECAAGTVRFARSAKNAAEREQASDSVKSCARECRLR